MITKKLFCKVLSMRDEQVLQQGENLADIVPNHSEAALCLLLSDQLNDKQNLITLSACITIYPLEVKSLHSTRKMYLHFYEELYDYLVAFQEMHCGET